MAESSAEPKPVGGLPVGPQASVATADERQKSEDSNLLVQSTVNRYVGTNKFRAAIAVGEHVAASQGELAGASYLDDNMSTSSIGGSSKYKRARTR